MHRLCLNSRACLLWGGGLCLCKPRLVSDAASTQICGVRIGSSQFCGEPDVEDNGPCCGPHGITPATHASSFRCGGSLSCWWCAWAPTMDKLHLVHALVCCGPLLQGWPVPVSPCGLSGQQWLFSGVPAQLRVRHVYVHCGGELQLVDPGAGVEQGTSWPVQSTRVVCAWASSHLGAVCLAWLSNGMHSMDSTACCCSHMIMPLRQLVCGIVVLWTSHT